jgi:hypothetical protein
LSELFISNPNHPYFKQFPESVLTPLRIARIKRISLK